MPIKSKDLAKLLGVSAATVSLLLNNKPGLSEELREKLTVQIRELGHGHMLASPDAGVPAFLRAADCGRHTVAYVIYPPLQDEDPGEPPFFPPILEGAEMEARERGYDLKMLHIPDGQNHSLRDCLNLKELMGVIVQPEFVSDTLLDVLEGLGVPYVFVDRYRCGPHGAAICSNSGEGIFSAVEYLKQKGHTRIGYVSGARHNLCFHERLHAFAAALRCYELPEEPADYFGGYSGIQAVPALLDQFSKQDTLPTALVAESDISAWHALEAAKKFGLCIPQDLSIIGFDDSTIACMAEPPLTTLHVPRRFWGRQLIAMLDDMWRQMQSGRKTVPMRLNIGVTLIERESVGPPNIAKR